MGKEQDLDCTMNLVHPDWEIIDPTPDIFALFSLFDRKFFQGRLACVQLEWSKRMYNCAGICYQRSNRTGKSCIIRLSEPLLKLRPRKNLVETLLHEMIHAYCFVLGIREGNGGHGPSFKKIMHGINKIAGTNITVYHTFHDEVNMYKTHWWKCNGSCQHRAPYYGMVKRTCNRKPGPSDFWWPEHQTSCGGEFIKVREPSPKRKKLTNKENIPKAFTPSQERQQKPTSSQVPPKNKISNYFHTPNTSGKGAGGIKKNFTPGASANIGGGTLVIRKPPATKTSTAATPTVRKDKPPTVSSTTPGGNLRNVRQFKDLSDDTDSPVKVESGGSLFSGRSYTVGGASPSGRSRLLDQFPMPQPKKPRLDRTGDVRQNPTPPETITLSDDSDYLFDQIDAAQVERTIAVIKKERQDAIKKEILDSFSNDDMEDIVLIDDDYDDELAHPDIECLDDSLTDTSVIDELFNDNDDLIEEFKRTNAKVKVENVDDEIVSCPMCMKKVTRRTIGEHLEKCYSDFLGTPAQPAKFDPSQPSTSRAAGTGSKKKSERQRTPSPPATEPVPMADQRQVLRDCGYSEEVIASMLDDCTQDEPRAQTTNVGVEIDLTGDVEHCECPSCGQLVKYERINLHLDICLG